MRALRSIVFWLHLVAGCAAGVVILTLAVTGALLAFERQITASVDTPAVMPIQSDSASQPRLESLLLTLASSGRGTPTEIVLHNSASSPVEARFGRELMYFLDPATAEIIGQPSEGLRTFFGSIERIHRSLGLGMQSAVGRGITGASNLAFLFMVISGMYLWLPKVFTSAGLKSRLLFRSGLRSRAREWNWHHVIGIWTSIPLFFIVLTGVIISYPWASNLLYTLTGSQPPAPGRLGDRGAGGNARGRGVHSSVTAQAADFRGIDAAVQEAKLQTSEWKSITVTVPQPQDKLINLSIDKSVGGQPEKAFQIVVNCQTGQVESKRLFSDNSTGRKFRAWARFLHTGEELGVFGQIVAAFACIGAVLLVWTGVSMALRRALARFELDRTALQTNPLGPGAEDDAATN
jgi:Uncharacterized iron-regulated membrane protein